MSASAEVLAAPAVQAPSNRWFVAVAVATGAMLEIVDTSIVNVALVDIQTSLGATLADTSWIVSSYAVANVIVLPMSAWLGKRFGQKRYFQLSLVGFLMASILCGMATTLPMLVIARVLQGLAGGGLLAKAQAILYQTFPPSEQPMAQALFGAVVIAGPVIGPTLGGWIVSNVGWRWIFFINLPIGVVAVLMIAMFLPKDERRTGAIPPVDWLGIGLLAVGLGSLQTFLEEGQSNQWFQSGFVAALGLAALSGLVLFVWRELTTEHPVVDLRVLRYRSLWAGSLLSIMIGASLYGALFAVPIFAQQIIGLTPEQTGLMLAPGAIASAFMMPIAGKVLKVVDPRRALFFGASVLVIALLWLAPMSPTTGEGDFFWPLIVRSIGTVFLFLPLNLATLGPIPRHDVAAAAGFFNLTRQLGGSIGVALLTTVLSERVAFHRTTLVAHLGATDPTTLERVAALTHGFQAQGFYSERAHELALRALDGTVSKQAAVMSFGDTFWLVAILVCCFIPFISLLGRPRRGAKPAVGH